MKHIHMDGFSIYFLVCFLSLALPHFTTETFECSLKLSLPWKQACFSPFFSPISDFYPPFFFSSTPRTSPKITMEGSEKLIEYNQKIRFEITERRGEVIVIVEKVIKYDNFRWATTTKCIERIERVNYYFQRSLLLLSVSNPPPPTFLLCLF